MLSDIRKTSIRLAAISVGCGLLSLAPSSLHAQPVSPAPAAAATDAVPLEAQVAAARTELAEFFAQQAARTLTMGDVPDAIVRQGDVLARIAIELAPNEARFHRTAADLALAVGDRDRSIVSLQAIRKLTPDDELTQVQLIDLFAGRMERGEQKVQYLETVVNAPSLPKVVRAHAATLLYDAYEQRGQDAKADAVLTQCLTLNPENLSALRIAFQRLPVDATPVQKVEKLSAMLRGNPAQIDAIMALGQLLAVAGRHDKAQEFYGLALSIGASKGIRLDVADGLNFLASQWLAGDAQSALQSASQLAQVYPDDADVRVAQVLLARKLISAAAKPADAVPQGVSPGEPNAGAAKVEATQVEATQVESVQDSPQFSALVDDVRSRLVLKIATLSRLLASGKDKLTADQMPSPGVPLPDVAGDTEKLVALPADNFLRQTYATALADLAFFELYAAAQQPAASILPAIAVLEGDTSALSARLAGWSHLLAGRDAEAQVKFDAAKSQDPIAALGAILLLQKTDKPAAQALAKGLLSQHRGGLVAAMIADRVKELSVSLEPQSDSDEIVKSTEPARQTVSAFVNDPRSAYVMTAIPVRVVHDFGEPMFADVNIRNSGRAPVTVGAGGMIDPRVFVDATIRGVDARMMPQQQLITLTGKIRIEPGQSFTQRVRLDGIETASIFGAFPTVAVPVEFLLVTNGVPTERGTINAAGGQSTSAGRIVERRASNVADATVRSELLRRLSSGSAVQRLRLADLFTRVSVLLAKQPDNAQAQEVRTALDAAIADRIVSDPVLEVRAFTKFSKSLREAAGTQRLTTLKELAADSTVVGQALSVLLAGTLPSDERSAAIEAILGVMPDGLGQDLAKAGKDALQPPQ